MTSTFHYINPHRGAFDVDLGSVVPIALYGAGGSGAGPTDALTGIQGLAQVGAVGTSGIILDDPNGTVGHSGDSIVGLRQFRWLESTCPVGNQVVWSGWIGKRSYKRDPNSGVGVTGVSRRISVELNDENAQLNFRAITGTDGNRPAETVAARLAWVLGSAYLDHNVYDLGNVVYSTAHMDKVDYREQYPLQVLQDCAMPIGFNFYVRWNETAAKAELYFYHPGDLTIDVSALSISNYGDADQTTILSPHEDADLTRDPNRVFGGVVVPYAKGSTYKTSAEIISDFGFRDGIAPTANIKTLTAANRLASKFLADNDEEDDRVTVTVTVNRALWTGILPGQLVAARFQQFPAPYDGWTNYRVVTWTLGLAEPTDTRADLQLELTPATKIVACEFSPYTPGTTPSFVQQVSTPALAGAGSGVNTPVVLTLPSAPTPGNFLVLTVLSQQSGHAPPDDVTYSLPVCWVTDVIGQPDGLTDDRLQAVMTAHHVVLGTDPATVTVGIASGGGPWKGYFTLAEYAGMGSAPTVTAIDSGTYQPNLGTAALPSVAVDPTTPGLIVANIAHEPDYVPLTSISSGWAIRGENKSNGGARQATAHADYIHAAIPGPVGGSVVSPGGADDYWWITAVAYAVTL
jgi:hypothetical protein